MKLIILLIALTLSLLKSWGQLAPKFQIKGRIYDQISDSSLSGASIICSSSIELDKTFITFTDSLGYFILDGLPISEYILNIKFMGFEKKTISVKSPGTKNQIDLGNVYLKRTGINLNPIEVTNTQLNAKIKRDTLEFNASFFRVKENATTEDLLKKIPGVQIDPNGIIRVNGEVVNSLMIDGKIIFNGDDPKIISRNIQADLIDKVQLIDQSRNENYKLTNGMTPKVINITIKEGKADKINGSITGTLGSDDKYATKVSLNRFKEKEQILLIGSYDNMTGLIDDGALNNIGKQKNLTIGINYSDNITPKLTMGASYIISNNERINEENSTRKDFSGDSVITTIKQLRNSENSRKQYINTKFQYKIDSLQTIYLSTQYGINKNNNQLDNDYQQLNNKMELRNIGNMLNRQNHGLNAISSDLRYEKNFQKKDRVLSINLNYAYSDNSEQGKTLNMNSFFKSAHESSSDTMRQQTYTIGNANQIFLMINYMDPITKKITLQINFSENRSISPTSKQVYNYNSLSQKYDLIIDSLSSYYKTEITQHILKAGLRIKERNYDYSFSLTSFIGNTNIDNRSQFPNIRRVSIRLLPDVMINYYISNSKKINFYYRSSIRLPSAIELRPILDYSNPFYVQKGNPDLKPMYSKTIHLGYNSLNNVTLQSFSINLDSRILKEQIINNATLDSLNRQTIEPINLNGGYNVRLNIGSNIPLKKKQSNMNINSNFTISKDPFVINGEKNSSTSIIANNIVSYNYLYKDLLDLSISSLFNYNNVRYKISSNHSNIYFNYGISVASSLNLPLNFSISSDLTYTWTSGLNNEYKKNTFILNLALSKTILPYRQGVIKIQGFDLLKQNQSIARNIGASYIEDQQFNIVQGLFTLKFIYFIGKKKE